MLNAHAISFAGADFHPLVERALWWPAHRALLVADLHLEKSSWYAGRGQLLPPFDSLATLHQLESLVDRLDPLSIWALGDSFHDAAGPERMSDGATATITRIARHRDMIWIAGNHDRAAALPGDRVDEAMLGDIVLRHEALLGELRPEISGHFHPKLRAAGTRRPCFVHDHQRMILPSFGSLTGGLDVDHPAIRSLLGDDAVAIIATRQRACRFALPPQTVDPLKRRRAATPVVAKMSHSVE